MNKMANVLTRITNFPISVKIILSGNVHQGRNKLCTGHVNLLRMQIVCNKHTSTYSAYITKSRTNFSCYIILMPIFLFYEGLIYRPGKPFLPSCKLRLRNCISHYLIHQYMILTCDNLWISRL